MKTMSRTNVELLRNDLLKALKSVADQHDIEISLGRITFSNTYMSTKLTAAVKSADTGEALSKEATDLKRYAKVDGIDLDKDYILPGSRNVRVRFTGYKSRNHKYPYIVTKVNATGHLDTRSNGYKLDRRTAKMMIPAS